MTDKATHTPLPCPFCGGSIVRTAYLRDTIYPAFWRVECVNPDCDAGTYGPGANTEAEALTAWNTRAVNSHHDLIEALRAIQRATLEGRVCDDVAWFDQVTTLHDYIEDVLHPFEPAAIGDLFPDTAALTKEAGHG